MFFLASATIKCLEILSVRGSLVSSSLLQRRMLAGPNLCRLRQPLEFKSSMAMPCLEDSVALYSIPSSRSYFFLLSCPPCSMNLGRSDLDVPFKTDYSTRLACFPALCPANISLQVHCSVQKRDLLRPKWYMSVCSMKCKLSGDIKPQPLLPKFLS